MIPIRKVGLFRAGKANKISTRWICETREAFRDFLDKTHFGVRAKFD